MAESAKNVLGEPLQLCCDNPKTGFFRDGFCNTNVQDVGTHVVCATMTAEFLKFTVAQGNDLVTPIPQAHFPGLKPGNGWCLCAVRWYQAYAAGVAPPVKLEATHSKALEYIPLDVLTSHAVQ